MNRMLLLVGLVLLQGAACSTGQQGNEIRRRLPFAEELDIESGTRDVFVAVLPFPGAKAEDAFVTVRDRSNNVVAQGRPNKDGEITFHDLRFGDYYADVAHEGSVVLVQELPVTLGARAAAVFSLDPAFLYRVPMSPTPGEPGNRYDAAFEEVFGKWLARNPDVFAVRTVDHGPEQMSGVVRTSQGAVALFVAHASSRIGLSLEEVLGASTSAAEHKVAASPGRNAGNATLASEREVDAALADRIVCAWKTAVGDARPLPPRSEKIIALTHQEPIVFVVPQNESASAAVTWPFRVPRTGGHRGRLITLLEEMHDFVEGHITEETFRGRVERLITAECRALVPTRAAEP